MAQEPRKSGLGRGLAALIPSTPAESPKLGDGAADIIIGGNTRPHKGDTNAAAARDAKRAKQQQTKDAAGGTKTQDFGASYQEIPIALIAPNPRQPRQVFDEDALAELVHSIREFGLMQPIVVRHSPADDGFEIIMGERRWRAAAKAGLTHIPAIIRETDDSSLLRDALLENIHRVQLNPLEEAAAYQQLLEEFGVTQGELADRIGRSRPVITNAIRLLALPVKVQSRVAAGVLSAGHARALLGLKAGIPAQEALADRIVAEGLSVRATEEAVMLANRGEAQEKKPAPKRETPRVCHRAAD